MKLNLLFLTLDDIMVLEFIGYSLEESLEDVSIGILEASREDDAIEILETEKVHLIIADMNIKTLESYEFYDKLQVSEHYHNIPFVFLSSEEDDYDIAILKGISNFFLKPLDVDLLLERLHDILKDLKSSRTADTQIYEYSKDDDILFEQQFSIDSITDYTYDIDNIIKEHKAPVTDKITKITTDIRKEVKKISNEDYSDNYLY